MQLSSLTDEELLRFADSQANSLTSTALEIELTSRLQGALEQLDEDKQELADNAAEFKTLLEGMQEIEEKTTALIKTIEGA